MKKIETSLYHLIRPPRVFIGDTFPTIIMLHGRGSDEEDLFGLAEYFPDTVFIISARAPYSFPDSGGYTWYDMGEYGKPEPIQFSESCQKLNQFIDDIKNGYPANHSKLFLFGFSMGTIMSYALSLTRPDEFAGVIANSGYIPEGTGLKFQWDSIAKTPFFIAHGTYDPIIPVSMARKAKDLLEQAGATFVYKEYPMAHQISEESLNDMMIWLKERL